MSITTGQIARAEGVSVAVAEYGRAGGGAAGWTAAIRALREHFPEATSRSLRTIIDYAQQTVAQGRRYQSGGADFRPDRGSLPDLRPLERRGGAGPSLQAAGQPTGRIFHEYEVDIVDPDTGEVWNRYPGTVRDRNVLSRSELEARIRDDTTRLLRMYDTVPAASGRDDIELQFVIRFRGAYIGY